MLDDDSKPIHKLARVVGPDVPVNLFKPTSPSVSLMSTGCSCPTANSWMGIAVILSTFLDVKEFFRHTEDTLRSQASNTTTQIPSKEAILCSFASSWSILAGSLSLSR